MLRYSMECTTADGLEERFGSVQTNPHITGDVVHRSAFAVRWWDRGIHTVDLQRAVKA